MLQIAIYVDPTSQLQVAHTSLSHEEHTQTDRAFQLIKESVWVDLAAGCMGGGGAIFIIGGNGSTISACKTVSRIWPVFGPSILIEKDI